MKIIDINGKERNVKDNLKIIEHTRVNDSFVVTQKNVDGELVKFKEKQTSESTEKYVEATVIGKSNEWVEWYQLGIFEKLNPTIKLK